MTSTHKGLPGLAGTDHIGITVPDIEQAVEFFVDVIGCEELYSMGPFRDDEGGWMKTHLNVQPRAVIPNVRMLRCKNGSNYELFEYLVDGQASAPPANSDIGGHHVAFYVDDIDAAVEHLRAHDVQVLGGPTTMAEGSNAGMSWVYFLAPWGLQMELVSYPNGQGYEKLTERRLWHPASGS